MAQFLAFFLVEDNDRLSRGVSSDVADNLAISGARASSDMLLTQLSQNDIPLSAPEKLGKRTIRNSHTSAWLPGSKRGGGGCTFVMHG